jgi:hypothetical protein
MVVWSDAVDDIISSVLDIEARLLKLVWKQRPGAASPASLTRASVFGSQSRSSLPNKKLADIELLEKSPTGSIRPFAGYFERYQGEGTRGGPQSHPAAYSYSRSYLHWLRYCPLGL